MTLDDFLQKHNLEYFKKNQFKLTQNLKVFKLLFNKILLISFFEYLLVGKNHREYPVIHRD